jgi:phosphoglycolate phosphatase
MPYRTLIFDFDGTIADTMEEARLIFNLMAPDYGIRQVSVDEIHTLRHLSVKELLDHLQIPKRRVPSLLARGTGLMRGDLSRLAVIDGMAEVLPALREKAHSFGILTSNSTSNVDLFLRNHGLRDLFDFISSTSKITGKAKHLRAIRKTFSLRAEEMLYIGDEIRDVKAAQKAGIPIAAVTWGFNTRESLAEEDPDHLFNEPLELLRLLSPH